MITEMKELQSRISSVQMDLAMKEASINAVKEETESLRRHLRDVSDSKMQEKQILVEDVTQLKKLADVSTQDIAHKEEERKNINRELHNTIQRVKEKHRESALLQTQLQEQIKQHERAEAQLVEKRSDFLRMQTALHQLEEQYLTTSQSVHEQIASELRKEAEKLRYQLREKQMSADEDKYLRNKMAEDCARLTKENGVLQSRVLEATKQLEREQQLREDESIKRTKRISELTAGKEKERQLELMLSHLKRLVQDEKEKVSAAQDQMLHVQQGRKSVELNGSSLRSQLTDLENKLSSVKLENSQLRMEKASLVEHISQLHKQIADRKDEIGHMQGHVDSLCYDMNSLQLQRDLNESSQRQAWQQLSNIAQGVHNLANVMTLK
ncbi:golgin subfamily A member 3-like [Spea bombifrons]|uniref:golgin subfamily A member 3-like n=1 Tax=Spea bombifrons TaxID=233779 RepID=UPI00234AF056|nr:golgin subfamily A member 3-like [Spea bombifrons]